VRHPRLVPVRLRIIPSPEQAMLATARPLLRGGTWLNDRLPLEWLGLASAGVALHAVVPFTCPFRALTGLDCPVCGATRAVGNVLHFHPMTALRDNLALLMLGCLFLLNLIPPLQSNRLGRGMNRFLSGESPALWISLILGWTVLRNLPGLAWLSPDR
jgi:hypothetical protein